PVSIVTVAGRASAPGERDGAVLLRGDRSALRLASAGAAAGGMWAVSGQAALEAAEGEAPASGPSILWSENSERAAQMLGDTHSQVTSPANAPVIVAPANHALFIDAWFIGPIRYVAPVQILLDCI